MNASQAEVDDILEDLIAYTDTPDPSEQAKRLSRLCLLLIDACQDLERVRVAISTAFDALESTVARQID